MDQIGKKVTHVRGVRHHANCLEKNHRQYEFTNFLDSYRRIGGHDQKIRALCATMTHHSHGKCKPIAGFIFFVLLLDCTGTYVEDTDKRVLETVS
jgi:hypothetical protein